MKVEKAPQVNVAGNRKIRILKPEEKLQDEYDLQKCLHDVGSQTQVWKAVFKPSGEDVIVKMSEDQVVFHGNCLEELCSGR